MKPRKNMGDIKENPNIHNGRRMRLKQQLDEHGIESFPPHNVLELLLFYAIPRRDTNEIAHRLLNTFGSLSGVFDAPLYALAQVDGIGRDAARFIKLMPDICRIYMAGRTQKHRVLDTSEKVGGYLTPYFVGRDVEVVYLLCLDAQCRPQNCAMLCSGSACESQIDTRKLIETAITYKSASVVLAHNHPGGNAVPSDTDVRATYRIKSALDAVHIALADHVIFSDPAAGTDVPVFCSMAAANIL